MRLKVILGFAHPCIVVPDLEAARAFYGAMFGFRHLSDQSWADDAAIDRAIGQSGTASRGCLLTGHNCSLELFCYDRPRQAGPHPGDLGPHEPGIRHLAFFVDDCQREYQRLLMLGGSAHGEPVDLGGGAFAVYCRDPFGNIIELCEIPNEAEDPRRLPGVRSLGNYEG